MLTLSHVSKSFDGGATFAVQDLSLEIQEGKTLVLLGSSGSGKTTTLKMINRLVEMTSGTIEIDGVPIGSIDPVALRRSIGYVFQGANLFPHLTIEENITIVLRLLKRPRKERSRRARELLELVGLDPALYSERLPAELSGGQGQRVGVARALASDPTYLLMDEPFGALDAVTRDGMQNELAELRNRLKKTILFVTHDIFEAIRLGDQIAVMNHGKIDQIGDAAELTHHPATDFVAGLFQRTADRLNTFKGRVE